MRGSAWMLSMAVPLILMGCSGSQRASDLEARLLEQQAAAATLSRELAQLRDESPPEIRSIEFLSEAGTKLTPKDRWIPLAERTQIRVHLTGKATQVDLIFVPTGSGTYKLQRVLDSRIVQGQEPVLFNWTVPAHTLGRVWVVAYNGRVGRRSEAVPVIREGAPGKQEQARSVPAIPAGLESASTLVIGAGQTGTVTVTDRGVITRLAAMLSQAQPLADRPTKPASLYYVSFMAGEQRLAYLWVLRAHADRSVTAVRFEGEPAWRAASDEMNGLLQPVLEKVPGLKSP